MAVAMQRTSIFVCLILLFMCSNCSCIKEMNDQIERSNRVVGDNIEAVEASTAAVHANVESVESSTALIQKNIALMEKLTNFSSPAATKLSIGLLLFFLLPSILVILFLRRLEKTLSRK